VLGVSRTESFSLRISLTTLSLRRNSSDVTCNFLRGGRSGHDRGRSLGRGRSDDAYEAEVQRSTQKAERLYRRAQKSSRQHHGRRTARLVLRGALARGPYLFPSFPGREALGVHFLGPGDDKVAGCDVHDLYDGQQMRPGRLAAWQALRERYGNRDESRVDEGALLPPAA
jgi:hypothetical protein